MVLVTKVGKMRKGQGKSEVQFGSYAVAADYGTAQKGCVARSMSLAFRDKGRSGHITVGLLDCERCVKLCPKRILTLKVMIFLSPAYAF